jgi:hypothetical protein
MMRQRGQGLSLAQDIADSGKRENGDDDDGKFAKHKPSQRQVWISPALRSIPMANVSLGFALPMKTGRLHSKPTDLITTRWGLRET